MAVVTGLIGDLLLVVTKKGRKKMTNVRIMNSREPMVPDTNKRFSEVSYIPPEIDERRRCCLCSIKAKVEFTKCTNKIRNTLLGLR